MHTLRLTAVKVDSSVLCLNVQAKCVLNFARVQRYWRPIPESVRVLFGCRNVGVADSVRMRTRASARARTE